MPNPAGNPEHLPRRRAGRPLGSKNRTPEKLRQIVLQALENKGGVRYIEKLADEEPKAFAMLLSRILPRQVDVEGSVEVNHRADELEARIIAGRQRVHQMSQQAQTVIDTDAQPLLHGRAALPGDRAVDVTPSQTNDAD